MKPANIKSILESVLFVYGEPISPERLAGISGAAEEEVVSALGEMKRDYESRGIVLLEKDGLYQLGSSPENFSFLEKLQKDEFSEELTRAALETLAIVAYKGPLSRVDIEYLRGVNSAFIVRSLLMRGLLERTENPKDARSYLYRLSFDFLKFFGLKNVSELPEYEEFGKKKTELPQENKF